MGSLTGIEVVGKGDKEGIINDFDLSSANQDFAKEYVQNGANYFFNLSSMSLR